MFCDGSVHFIGDNIDTYAPSNATNPPDPHPPGTWQRLGWIADGYEPRRLLKGLPHDAAENRCRRRLPVRRMSRVSPHNRRQESPPTITSPPLRLRTHLFQNYAFLGLCLALLASGCGRNDANRAAISGRVKLDGHPLERGSILLASLDGVQRTVTGAEIVDGEYRLTRANGPAVGWNRVEILALRKTGKMVPKPYARRAQWSRSLSRQSPHSSIPPRRSRSRSSLATTPPILKSIQDSRQRKKMFCPACPCLVVPAPRRSSSWIADDSWQR